MSKYEVGDRVYVIPGWGSSGYAGAGYLPGIFLTITQIDYSQSSQQYIYFFKEHFSGIRGIYEFALTSIAEIREEKLNNLFKEESNKQLAELVGRIKNN